MCIYVYMYVCMYMFICMCVYIYIYIYKYMYNQSPLAIPTGDGIAAGQNLSIGLAQALLNK